MSADKEWFEGRSVDPYEKCYWRRVGFAAFIGVVLAMVAGLLHGCATVLPACEKFQYRLGQDDSGMIVYVLDQDNAGKMIALVKGISEGKCRLRLDGEV